LFKRCFKHFKEARKFFPTASGPNNFCGFSPPARINFAGIRWHICKERIFEQFDDRIPWSFWNGLLGKASALILAVVLSSAAGETRNQLKIKPIHILGCPRDPKVHHRMFHLLLEVSW